MKSIFISLLTKQTVILLALSFAFITYSCKPSTEEVPSTVNEATDDISGLIREKIPGTSIESAKQLNAQGMVEIEGYLDGNQKTGQWIKYSPDGDILLINNYVNGLLEGVVMSMTFRNQVDLKTTYKQGKLNGPYTAFKFGKIIEERNYVEGKLEGTTKVYDQKTFKVKQETQFKNGLQDGYLRYYDEVGNVVLEYEYKNGEKISGGIVEPPKQ